MNQIIIELTQRKSELISAILIHIRLSLIALFFAIVISIPLAIVISKNKKISELIINFTGILQTIPSLALLGLLIPFFGIGELSAIIVLVIYGIFPITQNTIIALQNIDSSLEEAATAFGMTRFEKLKKFELALATPIIVGGIRSSSVMIIGTATLAALIGAGGLGSFILLGIDRNNINLVLIGAVSTAILAILINFIIKVLEKKGIKILFISIFLVFLLMFSSYYKQNMMEDKVIIAGKLGAEPTIIVNIYKYLIEKEANIKVEVKENFGKTLFLHRALVSKKIDIYPEYTGTIITSLLENKVNIKNDKEIVYNVARDEIKKQDNLILLSPMKFQNTYAIATKKDFANKYMLKDIEDLKNIEDDILAGFTLEFNDRDDGKKGLKKIYDLNLKVKTMEPSLRYEAIKNNEVQIIDAYSTDSQIIKNDLVVLNDNKHQFLYYQVAPLIREETLKKYPKIKKALNKLKDRISEDEIREMNYRVDYNNEKAKDVAKEYLIKHGLL